MKYINCLALALCGVSVSSISWAERQSYSALGIGVEYVNYQETTRLPANTGNPALDSAALDTEYAGLNFSQIAGAYVAVDQDWGFYINNNSTLGSQLHSESWYLNGVEVQNNSMTLFRGDTNVWATRQISPNRYLLFGGTYNRVDFERFNFSLTTAGEPLVEDPGNTVVSEETTELIGQFGYEYNEFFNYSGEGFKSQLRALIGVPLYSQTRNSSIANSEAFRSSFEGYGVRATASFGYQFSEHVLAAFSLDALYQHRNEQSRGGGSAVEILPERTLDYIQPSITVFWAF